MIILEVKMKSVTIHKSFEVRNRNDIYIHSDLTNETQQMTKRSAIITIHEGEFVWFSLSWWGTKKYCYTDFEDNGTYELQQIVNLWHLFLYIVFSFVISGFYMYTKMLVFKYILYVVLLGYIVLFLVSTIGGKRFLRLKKIG